MMVVSVIGTVLIIGGSLCLFLYGMKVMSEGIQRNAGSRLQGVLKFMTGNRFSAVFTGLSVTAIIQSSGATTVMVVSFVNAGLLTLKQAIGVIMGANIGTTVTAWIVSLAGFNLKISMIAIPLIGIGFLLRSIKWKHRESGDVVMGLGLLFLGLDFLTNSMPKLDAAELDFLKNLAGRGLGASLIGVLVGMIITLLLHSSSASTAIVITMAFNGYIDFTFAAAMVLGANIGTTIDAALAAIGTKTMARRAALVHILFNVIGALWAVVLLKPLVSLVNLISPGGAQSAITIHIAMFHTVFNVLNTAVFLPFVNQFARLVCFLIKDKGDEAEPTIYKFPYIANVYRDTPELSILRAEKEIRDMAALVFSMYGQLRLTMKTLNGTTVTALVDECRKKEEYADQMREELTRFFIECTRRQLNVHTERNVSLLIRIIADLEDMTDDCIGICMLLDRSVRKNRIFKQTEMEALSPYMAMVEEFLSFVGDHLGGKLSGAQTEYARTIEAEIDESRNKLRKLGQKRIEEGEDVKTELLFIDLVRRIERIGDYCNGISTALATME
jgi:phosphate:Na+ symporter